MSMLAINLQTKTVKYKTVNANFSSPLNHLTILRCKFSLTVLLSLSPPTQKFLVEKNFFGRALFVMSTRFCLSDLHGRLEKRRATQSRRFINRFKCILKLCFQRCSKSAFHGGNNSVVDYSKCMNILHSSTNIL